MNKDLTNSAVDRQNILNNPYALAELKGNRLKLFKEVIQGLDVYETDFGNITTALGVFDFRSFSCQLLVDNCRRRQALPGGALQTEYRNGYTEMGKAMKLHSRNL